MTIVYLSHGKSYSGTPGKKGLRYFKTLSAGLAAACTHRAVLNQLGGVKLQNYISLLFDFRRNKSKQ